MTARSAAPAASSPADDVDDALRARLAAVIDDGRGIWRRFERVVRSRDFHPFVPGNYERVLDGLIAARAPGARFLEWGSATGVITILADLLGFEAYGIELDARLVEVSRALAARHGSAARFAAGSLFPPGYHFRDRNGDPRTGTLGDGESAYRDLGHPLTDFDVVYGYPWDGEQQVMLDLMHRHGAPGAHLLLLDGTGLHHFRDGHLQS